MNGEDEGREVHLQDAMIHIQTELWQEYLNHIGKINEMIYLKYMKQPAWKRFITPRLDTTFSRWQFRKVSYDGFMAYLWERRAGTKI